MWHGQRHESFGDVLISVTKMAQEKPVAAREHTGDLLRLLYGWISRMFWTSSWTVLSIATSGMHRFELLAVFVGKTYSWSISYLPYQVQADVAFR